MARALARVSKARQLSIVKPVNSRVMERPDLIAWVKARVTKEVPPEAIVHEGRTLALLGFLPADYDYLGGTMALLDAQLAGLYEPDDGTMYIASDLDGDMAESTLDHELTHALQDQHYDLKSRTKYAPGQSDSQEALAMLSEGDAMSAMVDVLFARKKQNQTALDLPDSVFRMQAAEMNTGKAADTPAVMKASLVAPYIDGTLFVQKLRREGGWNRVDQAWTRPPASTEQVLHLDKWQAQEAPIAVDAPAPPSSEWTAAETDIYGELSLRIWLSQWLGDAVGAELARGWGGDRGVLFERGDVSAFALHVTYDPGAQLDGATLLAGIERTLGKADVKTKSEVCFDRKDRGPLAIRWSGRGLAIVAGGAHVTTGAMTRASTCAVTLAWARSLTP